MSELDQIQYYTNRHDSYNSQACLNMSELVQIQYDMNCYYDGTSVE